MFSKQLRSVGPSRRCKHCRIPLRRQQFSADFCSRPCWETLEYMQARTPDLARLGRFRDAVLFARLVFSGLTAPGPYPHS